MSFICTKEKLAIMQAWLDGKNVQYRSVNHGNLALAWHDCPKPGGGREEPEWAWKYYEYRMKPETTKYKRYLWKWSDAGARVYVRYSDAPTMDPSNLITSRGEFIRWIDTEWQEVEV